MEQTLPGRAAGRVRVGGACRKPGLYIAPRSFYVVAVPVTEEQLARDLTAAMKARDSQRMAVLRSVVAAAKHLKVERRVAHLEEADLVQVLRREVRQREEAEEFAVKAGRDDLVAQNRAERAILDAYVPAPLDANELERAIRALLADGTPRQMGAVMAALRERYPGRIDGKAASALARTVLGEGA